MSDILREFCAENFTDVPAAIEAGARRIELCDNLAVGGTTPSLGVVEQTVAYAHENGARVMCMIRPRGGDFVYSDVELAMMETDIFSACEAEADGIVFGCLLGDEEGGYRLDEEACARLMTAAASAADAFDLDDLDVTFHMAFDALPPEAQKPAIDTLAELGVTRILTHGGVAGTPIMGNIDRLRELTEYAAGRLIILPGAGITYENVDEVVAGIGAAEAHGTKIVPIK